MRPSEAHLTVQGLIGSVRVACSRRIPVSPEALWAQIGDPRAWAPLFVAPQEAAPRRVKLLDGETPEIGGRLQVLRTDRSWTLYEIERWDPARQVRLVARSRGHGQEEGRVIPGRLVERLILIPQGTGSEAEWTIDHEGALLARWFAAPNAEAWEIVLEARLDALAPRRAQVERVRDGAGAPLGAIVGPEH